MWILDSLSFLYVIVFLMPSCIESCNPEEGTEYNLTCTAENETVAENGLYWSFQNQSSYTRVAACLDHIFCSNMYPAYFVARLEGTKSTLTIKKVSRIVPFNMDNSKWTCEWIKLSQNDTVCNPFKVYSTPETITCEPSVLNSSTLALETTCTSQPTYPAATCGMQLSKNNVTFTSIGVTVSYNNTLVSGPVPYYKTQCLISLQLRYLESNGNITRFSMYNGKQTVYSDTFRINLAIVNEENGETTIATTDNVKDVLTKHALPIVIALAAAVVVILCVVVILTIVLCRSRRRCPESRMLPESSQGSSPQGYEHFNKENARGTDENHPYNGNRESDIYEN